MANTTFTPFTDLDDGLVTAKTALTDAAQIRKEAHIANGGEAQFDCPKCRGTGYWRAGYPCFACKGKGLVGKRVIAAAKGKETKARNIAQWKADHAAEIEFIDQRAHRWPFAAAMQDAIREWGKWTDNQLAAVRKVMAQDAEKAAERAQARVANAPLVPTAAIQALFDKAGEKLTKQPIFRTVDITISKAPKTGRNPGALYVKTTDDKVYCGKIVDGKFFKGYGAPDVTEALQKVAANPLAEAVEYGRKFKACACCGITLRDPVSVLAKVGPICAENWGLEGLRDAAREALAAEKAAEEDEA